MKFCILILYISMVIHEKEFLRNINCSVLWRIWFRSHLAYKILYNRFISDLSVSGSCMFLFTIFRFLWHCDVSFKDRPDIRSNFWPCTCRKLFHVWIDIKKLDNWLYIIFVVSEQKWKIKVKITSKRGQMVKRVF